MARAGPGTVSLAPVTGPAPLRAALSLGAAALTLLLVRAVVPPLALDLEGLVMNQSLDWTTDYAQVWYGRAAWVAPMQRLLWWGLPPVCFLLVAAALFRGAELLRPGLDPLPRMASGPRWVLGAGALLPLLAAVVPASLAVSTQIALESVAWIEWYGHVDPAMEQVHRIVPGVLAPSLALGGGLAVAWALAPQGSRWRHPLRVRRLRGLPAVGALLVLGLLCASAALVTGVRAGRAAGTADGRAVHAARCGECHERALPLYFVKTPGEWAETVRTHRRIERLPLDEGEAAALNRFLSGMRAYDDAWTFRTRCQSCHGSSWRRWEPRPAEDWEAIVGRLARWSPYYYNAEVREQIASHVTASKADPEASLGLPAADYSRYVALGGDCDDCHSIGYEGPRYAKGTRAEARAMVARMAQKMAEPFDEDRIDEATDTWLALVKDPALLARLFPHDDPEHSGGGL
jgi:mono/diheme cytochrome c family protein